ncbi:MAG: hypothetical protein EOP84_06945 [Verrucomicrobiaceae bacterium]|nr:MAG: hypothetical protein EOP84_06945 [Verrucomicrobiaceae bacterium]
MNEVLTKTLQLFEQEVSGDLIEALVQEGAFVWKSALPPVWSDALLNHALEQESEFKRARVGLSNGAQVNSELRRDQTKWWDLNALSDVESQVLTFLSAIKEACNRELYLGLQSFEGHYAIYDRGAFYKTHLDRFRSDDARTLSIVLFLNDQWRENEGGELKFTNSRKQLSKITSIIRILLLLLKRSLLNLIIS